MTRPSPTTSKVVRRRKRAVSNKMVSCGNHSKVARGAARKWTSTVVVAPVER